MSRMLIECGPRPLLLRDRDWHVLLVGTARGWYHYVCDMRTGWIQYGPQPVSILNAARVYGFIVEPDGLILNWADVPHLWEPSCDVD